MFLFGGVRGGERLKGEIEMMDEFHGELFDVDVMDLNDDDRHDDSCLLVRDCEQYDEDRLTQVVDNGKTCR